MNTRQLVDELNRDLDPEPYRYGDEDETAIPVWVFHVLFNIEGGPVQQENIMAVSFGDCEQEIKRRHPDAVHWEIGI